MERITAKNAHELRAVVAGIDISVPLRTEGRTTDDCEKWSICRLLATISDSEFLNFPIEVVHRDRPDFHIKQGSMNIGIEITEVISENDAAIDAYREHKNIDGPFLIKRHRPGDVRLTGTALRSAAASHKLGSVWAGDSVEREWVSAMQTFISTKVEKAKKPGFHLFSENWLLMYDNWSLPAVDYEAAAIMLYKSMKSDHFGPFQKIWIESSDEIRCFLRCGGVVKMAINNVWAGS